MDDISSAQVEQSQAQQSLKTGKKGRRAFWSNNEVRCFLTLMKEKKILGLMDGKRWRVNEIFKSLVEPMKQNGYPRDVAQLLFKYKNLKCKFMKYLLL